MFSIRAIEAVNFRNLGTVTIEPAPGEKITALNGPSGSGKSSIVHAIVWALFGVAPTGVKQAELRRQGTSGADKEQCSVTVTLEHAGDTIIVSRWLSGSRDMVKASITVNDTAITDLKATSAVEWVKSRLNMNQEEFLTAYVVRQKELDSLVTDQPADRKDTIERLAGLTSLSAAVDEARSAAREAASKYATLQGTALDVSVAQAAVTAADEDLRAAKEAAAAADSTAKERETAAEQAANSYKEMLGKWRTDEDLRSAAKDAAHTKELTEATYRSKYQQFQTAKEAAAGGDDAAVTQAKQDAEAADAALRDANEYNTKISQADTAITSLTTEVKNARDLVAKAETRLAEATTARDTARATVDSYPDDLGARRQTQIEAQQQAANTLSVKQAEGTRVRNAIDALSAVESAICPTCAQNVPDPAALIQQFTQDREQLLAEYKTAERAHAAASEELAGIEEQIKKRDQAVTNLEHAQRACDTAATDLASAEQDASDKQKRLQAATEEREGLGDPVNTEELSVARSRAQDAYDKALVAQQAAANLTQIEQAARDAHEAMTEADAAAEEANEKAQAATTTYAEVEAAEANAKDAQTQAATARSEHSRLAQDVVTAENTKKTADADLTRARQSQEMLDAAARGAERSATVASATEQYREARRIALLPELAIETTNLLDEMTAGRYVAVNFDETFTPVVTDSMGERRSVGMLSGGEQSVVALAMRLAIGRIIAGSAGEEGILVLDEVLSAQDADRRRDVLNAIGALGGRQIVMINHLPEAINMADLTYEFTVTDGVGQASVLDITPAGEFATSVA